MKYTNEVITLAHAELEKRRADAVALQSAHVDVIKDYPEIYSVYTAILSTKDKLADAILSKNGDARERINTVKEENLKNQELLKNRLKELGFAENYLELQHKCPVCRDTGFILGHRCDCLGALLDKFAVEELNKQCKIKLGSFADFNISYYPENYMTKNGAIDARAMMKEHLDYCMKYAREFSLNSPSVFMLGPTGLGKTFLSSCIAKEVLCNGFSVAFDSIQNYLRDIEKEHFGRSEGDTLETILNADLVILDDIGSEFASSFNSSVIYNIINSRTNQGKPTIVSSNLSFDELTKRYDDRIISRLTGMFKPMRFIGNDIRQIKRQNGIYN